MLGALSTYFRGGSKKTQTHSPSEKSVPKLQTKPGAGEKSNRSQSENIPAAAVHAMDVVSGAIGQVEGRSVTNAKLFMADGSRKLGMVFAIPPLDKIKLDLIEPVVLGEEIPPLEKHDAWVEKSAMQALGVKPGDMLRLELLDGQERQLRLVAYVHSVTSFPYSATQQPTLFVSPETIVWLGGDFDYNQVVMRVAEDPMNEAIRDVAQAVSEKIEDSGRSAYSTFILYPGRHFATDTTRALGMIMGIFSEAATRTNRPATCMMKVM